MEGHPKGSLKACLAVGTDAGWRELERRVCGRCVRSSTERRIACLAEKQHRFEIDTVPLLGLQVIIVRLIKVVFEKGG